MRYFETIGGLTWVFSHSLQNTIQNELNKYYKGINVERIMLLMELNDENGLRPSVVAKRMCRSKGTITSLTKNAVKRGMVVITPDESNRNAKRIYITQKGKRIHDEMVQILNEKMNNSLVGIPPETLSIVEDALRGCIINLEPEWSTALSQNS